VLEAFSAFAKTWPRPASGWSADDRMAGSIAIVRQLDNPATAQWRFLASHLTSAVVAWRVLLTAVLVVCREMSFRVVDV